jgi:hypothetical protein
VAAASTIWKAKYKTAIPIKPPRGTGQLRHPRLETCHVAIGTATVSSIASISTTLKTTNPTATSQDLATLGSEQRSNASIPIGAPKMRNADAKTKTTISTTMTMERFDEDSLPRLSVEMIDHLSSPGCRFPRTAPSCVPFFLARSAHADHKTSCELIGVVLHGRQASEQSRPPLNLFLDYFSH